jgi:ribonuclease D
MTTACPPKHTAYASELLAANAAQLHLLEFLHCGAYEHWRHGDHFHAGHLAMRRRKAKVRALWQARPARFRSRSSAHRAIIDSEAAAEARWPNDPRRP